MKKILLPILMLTFSPLLAEITEQTVPEMPQDQNFLAKLELSRLKYNPYAVDFRRIADHAFRRGKVSQEVKTLADENFYKMEAEYFDLLKEYWNIE